MNPRITCALTWIAFSSFWSYAHAAPELFVEIGALHQVGSTGRVMAGLRVRGETLIPSLTVGGGFTVGCAGGTEMLAEDSNHVYGFSLTVYVPRFPPNEYNIGAFNTLPAGRCRSCTFQYRGRATNAATGIAAGARGVNFSFSVGGAENSTVNTAGFSLCQDEASSGCRE